MTYEKKQILQSNPYNRNSNKEKEIRNVYYGEVISVIDDTEGGRIKVRIPDLDNKTPNDNLPYAYPLLPKFLHVYPQEGEVVRIIIEDINYPQRSRYWIGSVISQPHKIGFDNVYTALSTTNLGVTAPEKAPATYPNAQGVFPKINEIALLGRDNTDMVLRDKEVEIRAGRHSIDNILELNKINPASLKLTIEETTGKTGTRTSAMLMADKIGFISHSGVPKFKAYDIDSEQRDNIFKNAHPLGRGDVIVTYFEALRKVILEHVHPYPTLPPDKSGAITDLEKLDFTQLLQENIVIN